MDPSTSPQAPSGVRAPQSNSSSPFMETSTIEEVKTEDSSTMLNNISESQTVLATIEPVTALPVHDDTDEDSLSVDAIVVPEGSQTAAFPENDHNKSGKRCENKQQRKIRKKSCTGGTTCLVSACIAVVILIVALVLTSRHRNDRNLNDSSSLPTSFLGMQEKYDHDQCIGTYSDLVHAVEHTNWKIIALCPSVTIQALQKIIIRRDNVHLCCAQEDENNRSSGNGHCGVHESCTLYTESASAVLDVYGESSMLQGIHFVMKNTTKNQNASETQGQERKGNVHLWGGGHHVIQNCFFSGGVRPGDSGGGNLKITGVLLQDSSITTTAMTNVTISNTTFQNGYAETGGGGLFIENVHSTSMSHSTFQHNEAGYGGGFAILDSVSLTVKSCIFKNNVATGRGGGGWWDVTHEIYIKQNGGASNVGLMACNDLFCAAEEDCLGLEETVFHDLSKGSMTTNESAVDTDSSSP